MKGLTWREPPTELLSIFEVVLALIGATSEVRFEARFGIYSKFYVK